MNKRRLWIVLAVAALLGLAAAFISADYVRNSRAPMLPVAKTSLKAVVAVKDLPVGTIVTAEDVRQIDWPGDLLPAGFASKPEEVIGRGVITPVVANEPLLLSRLADKAEGGGLPIVVPEGMRAMSVRVNDVIGVAGFVVPDTRVDVLLTITPPSGGDAAKLTRIILQNIRTLASGQIIERDKDGKPITTNVVTLLVTPTEAETLALASNEGQIQLALRNGLDVDSVHTQGVRVANLVSGMSSSTPRPVRRLTSTTAARRENVVEVYRGGERTLKAF
jgi:pilus assembly protein CpaB